MADVARSCRFRCGIVSSFVYFYVEFVLDFKWMFFFKLANRKSVLVLSKLNRQIRHPSSFLILDDFDLDDFDCFR